MGIVLWIVFGLAVGLVAKLLTPGREAGGFVATAVLGVLGALLGGFAGRALGLYASPSTAGALVMSLIGAVILLALYNAAFARRQVP
jgi:uncharacterized membrane protein YeaQ/YmgE (transglycosylase-associated protein family)